MDTTFLLAVGTMGGLGLFFAAILAVANHKLHVEENPLIAQVSEALPQANCGACGSAGCLDFAVHLVEGNASITGCPIGGKALPKRLAQILQVEAAECEAKVAVLMCQGGHGNAALKGVAYLGPVGCGLREILSGGEKLCFFGCLGGGDCEEACKVGAIRMGEDGLPVVYASLCAGCGLCNQACPRGVLELHPTSHRLFVLCKNHDDARAARKSCAAACLGCGICARASGGAITIENSLAVIDYEKLNPEEIPIERCKPGVLKRLDLQ
jgi:Na+-translocating ferredoxin:NAD+ oxidoreductase subunit B